VPLTALTATVLLNGVGLPAFGEGNLITLGEGQVIVQPLCSGWTMMGQLLALALFTCCLFSTSARQKLSLFAVALSLGFFVNSCRVAVLTVLAGHPNPELFDIWDHGLYSPLFPAIAISLGGFLFWTILREPALGTSRLAMTTTN
jgi:exosortase/archaeosortase family protein